MNPFIHFILRLFVFYFLQCRIPEITALSFCKDGLTMGVGTSSGHAMLYDIRSSKFQINPPEIILY